MGIIKKGEDLAKILGVDLDKLPGEVQEFLLGQVTRSEEHTSELQSPY